MAALTAWLQANTAAFNREHGTKPLGVDLAEFLVRAASQGQKLYDRAAAELVHMTAALCNDVGRLVADVWQGFGGMVCLMCFAHQLCVVIDDGF